MRAEHVRQRGAQPVGDLEQQRAVQMVVDERREIAVAMAEVEPDGGFQAVALQRRQRLGRQEVVDDDQLGTRGAVGALDRGRLPAAERAGGQLRVALASVESRAPAQAGSGKRA